LFQLTLKVQYCTRTFVRFVLSYFRKYFRTFVRKYFRTKYFRTSVRVRVHVYSCTVYTVYEYKQLMEYLPKVSCISEDILSACSSGLLYTTTHRVFHIQYCILFPEVRVLYVYNYMYLRTTYNRLDFHKQLSPTTLFIRVEILER